MVSKDRSGTAKPVNHYTSDWHLGHERIIELAGRPFDSVDEMNEWIIQSMIDCTRPDDRIVIVGDVVMGKMDENLPLLRRFGEADRSLVLVPGNHDRVFAGYEQKPGRIEGWREAYEDVGCTIEDDVSWICPRYGAELVNVSHFPYRGSARSDHTEEERYSEFRLEDDGRWLICGHVHELWMTAGRQINVGVDAWAGRPVPDWVIGRLIEAGPADRRAPQWDRLY